MSRSYTMLRYSHSFSENFRKVAGWLSSLGVFTFFLLFADQALASGGIGEFTGPVEAVMNTITGPVGKAVAIIGMALCGFYFITNKEDISGGAKALLGIVFGICFIAFAAPIVNSVFSFSGALL
jgi:type IV secretion system protein VirB2